MQRYPEIQRYRDTSIVLARLGGKRGEGLEGQTPKKDIANWTYQLNGQGQAGVHWIARDRYDIPTDMISIYEGSGGEGSRDRGGPTRDRSRY